MLTFFKKNRVVLDSLTAGLLVFLAAIKFFFDNNTRERNWNLFLGIVFLGLAIIKIADVVVALRSKKKDESLSGDIN